MSAATLIRRWAGLAAALLLAALATGCAHPISLSGKLDGLVGSGSGRIDKKAGLAIAEADRSREVTTAGGGGDKVSYFPYRDLEAGIYLALSESFANVSRITGPADPKVKAEALDYVVTPTLTTTSYSGSVVTWPPTIFTIELSCKVADAQGKPVTELRVTGEGRAEYDEFKTDHSLSARRAAEDTVRKLIKALGAASAQLR